MYCENAAVDFMCSDQLEFKNYDVVEKKHCMQIAIVISVINLLVLAYLSNDSNVTMKLSSTVFYMKQLEQSGN